MSNAISEALNRVCEGAAVLPLRVRERVAVGSLQRVAFVPTLRGVDEATRRITFVASTESIDRYGDSLKVSGWQAKNYMKNPVFLWAHRSQDPPIGKCVGLSIESNPPALVQQIEFADKSTYEFADTIFQLYKQKFLRSVSVGFRPTVPPTPITDENGMATGGYEFNGQELMELSAVPLPANTDAVMRAVESGVVTEADAARVFKAAEPADEEDAEDLRSLLRQLTFEQFKLSLIRLEATVYLQSIARGSKCNAGSDEITCIEQLLSSDTSITSLDQLDAVLRGGK